MSNFNPRTDSIEMWIICEAIGKDHHLIDDMKVNEDGTYPVSFSVGGVELDFNNVAKRIKENFDDAVAKKAQELLDDMYSDLTGEIYDMQERIKEHQARFKYGWEELKDNSSN